MLGLAVVGGWVLGVVGFFKALRANEDIKALKRMMAQLHGAPATAATEAVVAAPWQPEPAQAEPVPEPEAVADEPYNPPPAPRLAAPKRDLEALLTMRWGTWLGAAALLLSGVFLIRYAVDQGFLGPPARCAAAFLLGIALLAGAEWLRRRPVPETPGRLGQDQAPAALAAGGVAVLFGAAYGSGPFYDLLPPLLAFVLMAAAALVGLLISLRFGQLVAAIGVAGAFTTPLLVANTDPSLPGLFVYLFVVTAAALAVVRYTAWTWLGWAATIAGAIWVPVAGFTIFKTLTPADHWFTALFIPASAALNLFLLPPAALEHKVGRRLSWIPVAVLGVAGLVLEVMTDSYAPIVALLLLTPLAVAKATFEQLLDRLPWLTAGIFLLTLLFWALPTWSPTGEAITVEGVVQGFLPGSLVPEIILPLLLTAAGMAAFYAVVGLFFERHARNPLRWSALTAAVPVLTMTMTYTQVERFQTDVAWAFSALALTALLVGAAALAAREGSKQRAGVHAAGAVAALALACAMLLREHWLTVTVALFLPALAWIEARADLPALRRVALAVAGLVLVRLLLNWYVVDYDFGRTPVLNGLLLGYGVPAVAFAVASVKFRRRADDLLVGVLEAGAVAFACVLVALEIRHAVTRGALLHEGSFLEITLHLSALAAQACASLWIGARTGRRVVTWAGRLQGGVALAVGAMLLVANPAVTDVIAGTISLLAGYLVPGLLAVLAMRRVKFPPLGLYALLAIFAWISLEIRNLFHPGALGLGQSPAEDAELWSWSGAWLAYGAVLLFLGIRSQGRALRLASLAIIGLATAKVFLIDMAGLAGLWRVMSFLGLGLALIALGAVYRRFVVPTRQ